MPNTPPLWSRFRRRLKRQGMTLTRWATNQGWSREHVWMAVHRPGYRGGGVLPAIRAYLNRRGS